MLWMTIEAGGGSDVKDCCEGAVALATKLGIGVKFNHNGIVCHASPNDDPKLLYEDWDRVLSQPNWSRNAFAIRR